MAAPAPTRAPVAAPAPAPVAAPAPAPTTAVTASKNNGKHKGRKHDDDDDADEGLVLAGTVSGNVLNVTAITHGKLKIGSKLEGTGLPRGTRIVGFGTGTGGVGTYYIETDADRK